jgi:hypothetical protein
MQSDTCLWFEEWNRTIIIIHNPTICDYWLHKFTARTSGREGKLCDVWKWGITQHVQQDGSGACFPRRGLHNKLIYSKWCKLRHRTNMAKFACFVTRARDILCMRRWHWCSSDSAIIIQASAVSFDIANLKVKIGHQPSPHILCWKTAARKKLREM